MTLRSRMMIAFAYLLLLAILSLSAPLGYVVSRHARNSFAIRLTNRVERIAERVPAALDRSGAAVTRLAQRNAHERDRLIITDAAGRLLADSTGRRPVGTDYNYRPEIVQALEGRETRLVREYVRAGLQYVVAAPVVDEGRVIGAVRINSPVAQVDARANQRLLYVAGMSVAILVVGLIVAALLARALTKPLRRLASVAAQIGEGRLDARAPPTAQPEVAEVAGALNTMSERIEQAMTAQADFVANASHQLRTPLTGLRLRLESLQLTGAPGADAALAETDRLAGLIDDLLQLVRAGTAPLHPETTDVGAAVEQAVDRWSVQAAEEDHVLAFDKPAAGRRAVISDADLAIILDNLIENALKYTPAGTTVSVSVPAHSGDEDVDWTVLEVADDGPGIAPEDRDRAFERFFRGTAGKAVPGTGLGLAIVRQAAQRWGGSVQLHGDSGTCVRVYLQSSEGEGSSGPQLAGVKSSAR